MGNLKRQNRPFIKVKANKIEGTWLYDTGASVSCMSLEQFRRIPPEQRPIKQDAQVRLLSAAKTEIRVVGMYILTLNILGKTFSHPVHVCSPMNQGGIVGMDIIKKLGLTYLPIRKTFVFDTHIAVEPDKQHDAPTVFKKSAGVVASLATDRQIKIPPHSQKVISINCSPTHSGLSAKGATAVANIFSSQFPLLWGGAGVDTNQL